MKVEISYITNIGKVRYRNEDAILTATRVFSETSMEQPIYETLNIQGTVPFAVADGMGGHPCGDKASGLVLEVLKEGSPETEDDLKGLLFTAKEVLDRHVERNPECLGMGTAVAGVFLSADRVMVFNVGDCRVYRMRECLERLTRDHTVVQEIFERGLIGEEEMRFHPERNVLTSSVMGGYPEEPKVFSRTEKVLPGDLYLICSDGLWEEVSRELMETCIRKGVREGGMCLFEKAYTGGRDNISFILIRVL
ncbi:MAG: hypothetical protein Q9N26_05320 [Aquificota bacterium]|nr:hypothetical protein [Aquificota bacterium]